MTWRPASASAPVAATDYLIPLLLEQEGERVGHQRVVVDDQQPSVHCPHRGRAQRQGYAGIRCAILTDVAGAAPRIVSYWLARMHTDQGGRPIQMPMDRPCARPDLHSVRLAGPDPPGRLGDDRDRLGGQDVALRRAQRDDADPRLDLGEIRRDRLHDLGLWRPP